MTQRQEQKLARLLDFRDFLKDSRSIFGKYPEIEIHYHTFLNCLNQILKSKEMMEENTRYLNQYAHLKEALIISATTVSRNITAYALLEELTDVQGLFCYSIDELSFETDEKIMLKCQSLLLYISNHRLELVDYGIDGELENKFRDLTDQFKAIVETWRIFKESSHVTSEHIDQLLLEATDIVENKMNCLSSQYTFNS